MMRSRPNYFEAIYSSYFYTLLIIVVDAVVVNILVEVVIVLLFLWSIDGHGVCVDRWVACERSFSCQTNYS